MIRCEDIFFDQERLCMKIAEGQNVLKGIELPQNKKNALLFHEGSFTELPWQGLQMLGERCCIVFFPSGYIRELPIPAAELSTTLRSQCIRLLWNLSIALEKAGDAVYRVLDSVPLSNIWFFSNGDILLLSSQMGDFIDLFEYDAERHEDKEIWYAYNCRYGFGSANYLCQLLYYSLSGRAPFADPAVRENGFKAIPLEYLFDPSETRIAGLCQAVDTALSDNRKFQAGIRHPYEHFRDIIRPYADLDVDSLKPTDTNPGLESFGKKMKKRANLRVFVRKKGFKVAIIIVCAAIVLGIAGFYIWQAVKPPATRDLDEAGIINWYYEMYTELDVTNMKEPLRFGYEGPDMVEVSTMFVTSTMQKAYDQVSLIIDPRQWIAGGMGPLPESSTVFGVSDVIVEKLTDDLWRATVTAWSSTNYLKENESTLDLAAGMDVFRHTRVVEFTFRTKSDWREVSRIEVISDEIVETIHVEYQKN
ncbi:MAG: hypothetical protein J5775_04420 [Spirochaetales bacterium]|nr:hypothetical protein [Spirochaetales bacterium]